MKQNYFLGLDMGTGSTGWAVTDENYEIIRKHGKSLWGVRLFETANTAEERRLFRTARRRLDRRNQRIQILQEIFAEEIGKVDGGFFLRMKESRYVPEDKRDSEGKCPELPYALFVDKEYTDKDYHKEFPTIYHLRKSLMETDGTPDIRLIYLALHHMMKHRGHFLLSGDINHVKEFKNTFEQFLNRVKEELDFHLEIDEDDMKLMEETLKNKRLTKSSKKTNLIKALNANTRCEKAILNLLVGGTVKLSDIFGNNELDNCERTKISFSDSQYDDYIGTIETDLGEQYIIIESAKAVYDWSVLVDILGDSISISEAKVKVYEKHRKDLAYLKKVTKKYLSTEDYKRIFVITDEKVNNYCAYVGMTKVNGKKVDLKGKQCTKEEFYDFLKKQVINKIEDCKIVDYMKDELEKGTFLPKQTTKDNGVLPYQIHLYELKKILNNLGERIQFIKENSDKIVQLFTFQVPYYVGPLNVIKDENSDKYTWAKRRSNEKIYPWNFEEVIDIESSAEEFICRMTNKCTYLPTEDVLPKDSLLYSKFMVLNELNNLKLNGEKITVELKQKIYVDLFQKYRKVTKTKLLTYLINEGITDKKVDITGIDGDFKASLRAYHDFKEKLTGVNLNVKEKEQIIRNIVLFGDDKKLLKRRIKKLFPNLSDNQIKGLCMLSYKGWGRLSKKFLEEIEAPAPETGEVWNIISALWETNDNLMQLLSEKYLFTKKIEEMNKGDEKKELTYKTVEELYVSPAVKRQIWQTLQLVKEIQKLMKSAPKRIFVEMAREKSDGKHTNSRKKQLLDLYKACKKEESNWIEELNNQEEHQLRSDKLYLYYTQKGRCMYSGEIINLEDLWDNRKYDIDHIYPQSKVMDDSLNNRVLVKKEYNAKKSDNYPIKAEIQQEMQPFWQSLLIGKFISKEKYERLTRKDGFSPDELAGFIKRQLVETRQSTKAATDILKNVFPNTEIVYVKAKNVSQFRKDFKLTKVRDMNDLHHAKDAYLNIIVGNAYFVKFTKDAMWYVKENSSRTYNLKKMFTSGYDIVRNGEIAWCAGEKGTICTVRKNMSKNNILVTRKSYVVKGGLFDQQLMKKGKGQVPIKGSDERLSDIQKYGGYNKATGTYFMLVDSLDKKGNPIRTIEYVPLYLKEYIEKDEKNALLYLEQQRGLKEPKVLLKKIKIDTLFNVDGFYMWLSGRTGDRLIFKGANQLLLSNDAIEILKKVLKYVHRAKENKNLKLTAWDELTENDLLVLYDTFLYKIQNTVYKVKLSAQEKTLVDKRDIFMELSMEEKCIVLSEILHMFQCQSGSANLKLIGGPGKAGILVLNSNITKCMQISIVHQSITGVFEQEVDLLAL